MSDVKLIEPETARPQEPRQQGVRKQVLVLIALAIIALMIVLLFIGSSSEEPPPSPMVGATLGEPVVTASTADLVGDKRDTTLFELLERGVLVQQATEPAPSSSYPATPETTPNAPQALQLGGNPWAEVPGYGQPYASPYGQPYGQPYGAYGAPPPQQNPELEAARRSNPLVFDRRRRQEHGASAPEPPQETAPYRLVQGTVIPAVLVTELNSQRPGPVIAQVTRDVYDATIEHVLIPQGTRIVGSFEGIRQADQEHVVLAWSRLIYPDGTTQDLPDFQAIETGGESGLSASVKRPWGGAIRQIALASAFTVGGLYAASRVDSDNLVSSILVFQLVNRVLDVGQKLLGVDRQLIPRVRVPAGYRFNVYAISDIPISRTWNR